MKGLPVDEDHQLETYFPLEAFNSQYNTKGYIPMPFALGVPPTEVVRDALATNPVTLATSSHRTVWITCSCHSSTLKTPDHIVNRLGLKHWSNVVVAKLTYPDRTNWKNRRIIRIPTIFDCGDNYVFRHRDQLTPDEFWGLTVDLCTGQTAEPEYIHASFRRYASSFRFSEIGQLDNPCPVNHSLWVAQSEADLL